MPISSGADEIEGVVRWYDPQKGYGFVAAPQRVEGDIFLHCRNLKTGDQTVRWPAGTKVRFKVRSNVRTGKIEAIDATILEKTDG